MSKIHKTKPANEQTWDYEDIAPHTYEGGAAPGAVRRVLIGKDEGEQDHVIRYFTIPAGGHSAHESHAHPHSVVITHGGGQVLLGDTWHDLNVGDAIRIDPNETHQLRAKPNEPLGFICVIPNKEKQK
jgi:quercetin dioxygenase-like cupin family protein